MSDCFLTLKLQGPTELLSHPSHAAVLNITKGIEMFSPRIRFVWVDIVAFMNSHAGNEREGFGLPITIKITAPKSDDDQNLSEYVQVWSQGDMRLVEITGIEPIHTFLGSEAEAVETVLERIRRTLPILRTN